MAKMTEEQLEKASDEELMEKYGAYKVASQSLSGKAQRKSFRKESSKIANELVRRGHTRTSLKKFV